MLGEVLVAIRSAELSIAVSELSTTQVEPMKQTMTAANAANSQGPVLPMSHHASTRGCRRPAAVGAQNDRMPVCRLAKSRRDRHADSPALEEGRRLRSF